MICVHLHIAGLSVKVFFSIFASAIVEVLLNLGIGASSCFIFQLPSMNFDSSYIINVQRLWMYSTVTLNSELRTWYFNIWLCESYKNHDPCSFHFPLSCKHSLKPFFLSVTIYIAMLITFNRSVSHQHYLLLLFEITLMSEMRQQIE